MPLTDEELKALEHKTLYALHEIEVKAAADIRELRADCEQIAGRCY